VTGREKNVTAFVYRGRVEIKGRSEIYGHRDKSRRKGRVLGPRVSEGGPERSINVLTRRKQGEWLRLRVLWGQNQA